MNPRLEPDLRSELLKQLLALNTHAFLRTIALLLERMGYVDVQLTSRKDWRGRHVSAGIDLTAVLPDPLGHRRVIVQAKQYSFARRLYQRTVDEIRGAALRCGASEALLLTTSDFASHLRLDMLATAPLLPVQVINGRELVELMIIHQVGILEIPPFDPGSKPKLMLHRAFFQKLEDTYSGGARPEDVGSVVVTLSLRRARNTQRVTPVSKATQLGKPKEAALPRRS